MKKIPSPLLFLLGSTLLLAGCGGGSSPPPPATPDKPVLPPATVSVAADSASVMWNTASSIDVLANDSASRGALSVSAVAGAQHGTATVSANKILYTPAAGFFGTEKLTYTVVAAEGGASAQGEATVTVEAAMTLNGKAGAAPLASATVAADIGSKQFTTTTDATGAFSLPVRSITATDSVILRVTGAGAQAHIRLTSAVGSVDSLARRADAQGHVAASAVPALAVTPVSTALAALSAKASFVAGNPVPLQGDVSNRVKLSDVMRYATAIRMVADHGVALPANIGGTDTLMLSGDNVAAVFAAANLKDRTLATKARAALEAELDAGSAFSLAGLTERTVMYYGGDFTVTYRADGSGKLTSTRLGERPLRWSADGATVRLTYDQPVEWLYEPYMVSSSPYSVREITTGMIIRLALNEMAAKYGETGTVTWGDGPNAGQTAPPGRLTTTNEAKTLTSVLYTDRRLALPATAAGTTIFGAINMPEPVWNTDDFFAGKGFIRATMRHADALQFQDGAQAKMMVGGQLVNYKAEDNWVTVTYANGTVWRYALMADFAGSNQLWIAEHPAMQIKRPFVSYAPVLPRMALTPEIVTRTYAYRPSTWDGKMQPDGSVIGNESDFYYEVRWLINAAGELVTTKRERESGLLVRTTRFIPVGYVGTELILMIDDQNGEFSQSGYGFLADTRNP